MIIRLDCNDIKKTKGSIDGNKGTGKYTDYSNDELKNQMKEMQAEVDRRLSQNDKILLLARKICADNCEDIKGKNLFIDGKRDVWPSLLIAKEAIKAGIKLQKEDKA